MKTIYNHDYQKLIQSLIALRKTQRLTQAQIAEQLGKPQSYIAKIEVCERKLDILEFVALCHCLNTKASDIIKIIEKAE